MREALRKYIVFKRGTEKDTKARMIVATRVTKNPGVAGRIMVMF